MIKPTFILILCSYIKIIITGVAIPKANAVVETYSIETAYYGGSAQSGAIFDVVIGEVSDVTIIEVDLHISSQVQENVEIWFRHGTWINYDKLQQYWIMAGCATITTSSGYGLPTTIPPNQMDYIYAQAGTTIALYTTLIYPGGFLQYSNFNPIDFSFGVVTGDVIIDNGHMALLVGAGKTYRFGSGTFMDRVWNGGIRYMLGVQNRIDGQIPDNGCRISAEPSLIPSLHPTMSFAPSLSPTFSGNSKSPSSRPSMYPSSKPTFRPTKRPTQHPTKTVSMKPSYKPSVMESSGPTKFKSSYPSLYPTVAKLTLEPSIKTSLPTIDITMSLSWVPIGPPVLLTSLGPTKVGATSLPSIEPSFINNVVRPSEAPSVSNYPSILNSYPLPSLNPSRSPITQSSLIPSVVPSFVRSGIPSEIPSEISLLISAVDETVTGTPSDVPSATLSTSSTGTALLAAVAAAGAGAASASAASAGIKLDDFTNNIDTVKSTQRSDKVDQDKTDIVYEGDGEYEDINNNPDQKRRGGSRRKLIAVEKKLRTENKEDILNKLPNKLSEEGFISVIALRKVFLTENDKDGSNKLPEDLSGEGDFDPLSGAKSTTEFENETVMASDLQVSNEQDELSEISENAEVKKEKSSTPLSRSHWLSDIVSERKDTDIENNRVVVKITHTKRPIRHIYKTNVDNRPYPGHSIRYHETIDSTHHLRRQNAVGRLSAASSSFRTKLDNLSHFKRTESDQARSITPSEQETDTIISSLNDDVIFRTAKSEDKKAQWMERLKQINPKIIQTSKEDTAKCNDNFEGGYSISA